MVRVVLRMEDACPDSCFRASEGGHFSDGRAIWHSPTMSMVDTRAGKCEKPWKMHVANSVGSNAQRRVLVTLALTVRNMRFDTNGLWEPARYDTRLDRRVPADAATALAPGKSLAGGLGRSH